MRGLSFLREGDFLHVHNHAVEEGTLFVSDDDRAKFLWCARRAPREHISILAWSFVGNHFHFLLKLLSDPSFVAAYLRDLQARYAEGRNLELGRRGALHWGRYGRVPIASEEAARYVVAYIHANRVKDGFCNDADADRWSSHRAYLGLAPPDLVDLHHRKLLFGTAEDYRAAFEELLPRWTEQTPEALFAAEVLAAVGTVVAARPVLARYQAALGCAALVRYARINASKAARRVGIRPSNGARAAARGFALGEHILDEIGARLRAGGVGRR
ncbi:MAG: hypothetical protein R3F59_08095 [Myxococcota bacterium]